MGESQKKSLRFGEQGSTIIYRQLILPLRISSWPAIMKTKHLTMYHQVTVQPEVSMMSWVLSDPQS